MTYSLKEYYKNQGVDLLAEVKAQGGFDYEDKINNTLQKHGLQPAGHKSAGSSADAPDGVIVANGKTHKLEIKASKGAMMGQLELHHDGKSWHVSARSKQKYPATAAHIEKHFIPKVNKEWSKPTGDYDKDLKMGNVYHVVKGTEAIRDHYGKDRKTPYMQIGGSGLHHMIKDVAKIGTHKLSGDTQFRARMKYRATDAKTGKKKYGSLVVFSLKNHENSHIDLEKHAPEIAKNIA